MQNYINLEKIKVITPELSVLVKVIILEKWIQKNPTFFILMVKRKGIIIGILIETENKGSFITGALIHN
jgi:hypothetical protein